MKVGSSPFSMWTRAINARSWDSASFDKAGSRLQEASSPPRAAPVVRPPGWTMLSTMRNQTAVCLVAVFLAVASLAAQAPTPAPTSTPTAVQAPAQAQPSAPIPRYEVKRAATPIAVDGKLDDAAWAARRRRSRCSSCGNRKLARNRRRTGACSGMPSTSTSATTPRTPTSTRGSSSATIRRIATTRSRFSSTRIRSRKRSTTASR